MKLLNSLHFWGYTCIVCGLLLFTNGILAETQAHGPDSGSLLAWLFGALGGFGFLFAFLGLQSIRAAGSGWLPKLSGGLILIGFISGFVGGIYLLPDPNRVQFLTPLGSVGVTLGWLVYGIGVLRTKVLHGWQRFVPLMLGLWFFIQLPLQILFFFPVRDRPSYLIVMGGYGVLIALLGYTMLSVKNRTILATP